MQWFSNSRPNKINDEARNQSVLLKTFSLGILTLKNEPFAADEAQEMRTYSIASLKTFMKKTHILRLVLSFTATLLVSGNLGRAATETSNLGETGNGSQNFSGNVQLASSFTTDNLNYTLNSLTLSLDSPLANNVTVTLSLFADASGAPTGSALETFTPLTFSSGGDKTFNSTGLGLTPDTTYWLTASGSGSVPVWFATASTAQTGSWSIGDNGLQSTDGGTTWSSSANIGQFSVDASPVPEPAPLALVSLAAACYVVWRRRKAAKPA